MIPSKYLVLNRILLSTRDQKYISGQEIAEKLGLSRSAVNKAVIAIREEGYQVDAVNHKGYRLISDPNAINYGELLMGLSEERLESVATFDMVTSTNVTLHELAEGGAPSGQVVIASAQTAGRGRGGSTFDSPDNKSIYMSYLIKPEKKPDVKSITPAVAQIVADAIKEELSEEIKAASNGNYRVTCDVLGDVFLNDKKICGILTEMLSEVGTGYIRYIMVGIGIRPINEIRRADLVARLITTIDKMIK